jgi:hypothetical protein
MTPEETVKPRRTRKVKEEHLCHVHDNIKSWDNIWEDINDVRKKVCRNLETTKHTDGNYYCLFHQPTEEKNDASGNSRVKQFADLFDARLYEHDKAIAKIEAEFPDDKDKQPKAKHEQGIYYDFRYVWFPPHISFRDKTFSGTHLSVRQPLVATQSSFRQSLAMTHILVRQPLAVRQISVMQTLKKSRRYSSTKLSLKEKLVFTTQT